MEIYDAFSQGVRPGGLRSKNEIRLLICYVLSRCGQGVLRSIILEVLSAEEIANYFEISQALEEDIQNNNIEEKKIDGEDYLFVTPQGVKNAQSLEDKIPYSVRESALNSVYEKITRLKRESENKIEIIPNGEGRDVKISVVDSEGELMTLSVYVPDAELAQHVKEKFLEDPVKLYSTIVAMLMA